MRAVKAISLTVVSTLVLLFLAPPASAQTAATRELPLVWVLSTGGTISGQGASSTSLVEYKSGALLGEQLVAGVPEIKRVASVKVEQIANVPSADVTIANWLTIANRINAIFRDDPKVAGVVVTHGTNTLEETAYFLNLTVKSDHPVVMVGSMRPASAISADGPLNLLNAIRTAVSPEARGKGVLAVLNDEINAARDVTKTNTYRVETFRAPELGLSNADCLCSFRALATSPIASARFTRQSPGATNSSTGTRHAPFARSRCFAAVRCCTRSRQSPGRTRTSWSRSSTRACCAVAAVASSCSKPFASSHSTSSSGQTSRRQCAMRTPRTSSNSPRVRT